MKIKLLLALLISATCFFLVSGRLCTTRAKDRGPRNDIIFDADMALYTETLTGPVPRRPSPLHALLNVAYRPLALLLARALGASAVGGDQPGLLAVRVMLAAFSALGIAAVVRIAGQLEVEDRKTLVLFPTFLLASSNLMACIPESYGLSLGLLAVTSSVILVEMNPYRKAVVLAVLACACGGTTITNALYPGGAIVALALRRPEDGGIRPAWLTTSLLRALILAPPVLLVALIFVVRHKFLNLYHHITSYLHLKIIRQPGLALREALYDLIFPLVAPYPYVPGYKLTYDSLEGITWTWVHVAGAAAWGILLAWGIREGLRSRAIRGYTLGLIGWVGFNLALLSVWSGPDHLLYTPLWSWGLMVLALIAARRLSVPVLIALCLPIVAAQVMTLRFILRALDGLVPL